MRTLLAILAVAAAFTGATLAVMRGPNAAPASGGPPPESPGAPAVVRGHLDAATPTGPDAGRTVVAALPEEVTITVRSSPSAAVRWGGRALGTTPLVLKRPRGSGPLDLTLNAGGCLPLHIRAYTFTDDTLNVRLVRESQKETVFGYPAALDAGVPEAPVSAEAPPSPDEPPSMP